MPTNRARSIEPGGNKVFAMGGSTSASAMPSTSITLGLNSIALRVALRYRLSLRRSASGSPSAAMLIAAVSYLAVSAPPAAAGSECRSGAARRAC